jgi:NADPH:quinone reductase
MVRELPYIPGSEAAGTVAEAGPGVNEFALVDRVLWANVPSSYVKRAVVSADLAVPVPDGVDVDVVAAVLLQGLTAHYLSHTTCPVKGGDAVVVHAAAGGVGRLLIQLVKRRGATVIGATSTPDKAGRARSAGADHVVGYDELSEVVRDVTDGEAAAVIFDGLGRATFDAGLSSLRRRGCLVVYGASSGPVPPFKLQGLATGGSLFLTRSTLRDHVATRHERLRRAGDVFTYVGRGELDVRIGGRYALDDVGQAHADLEARRTTGKLLVVP